MSERLTHRQHDEVENCSLCKQRHAPGPCPNWPIKNGTPPSPPAAENSELLSYGHPKV